MVLVSRQFPDFTAPAVFSNGEIIKEFNLKKYINNRIAVIFFWPMDFTFVCPTELIAFNNRYNEFEKREVKIIGISIDSVFVHQAWRNTSLEQGGIGKLKYPMVSDIKHEIQKSYGIEHHETGVALRASFLIDIKGIIRHQIVNDLSFGRNIDEMLRMVDAVQFNALHGEVCPAQWKHGKPGIITSREKINQFIKENYEIL
ncbi:MAG: peroxiredoxin C [Candidatus Dasytiphilus stammeri]